MHFFIDHTKLPVQGTSQRKFGPDPTTPTTAFCLSTEFQLTQEAKAFACQAGMMVVQRNNDNPTNLVNLIIKPLRPTSINGVTVRYYIYRRVQLSSFFSGANIVPEDAATNTQFIAAFWRDRHALASANPPAPTPLNFGYGDNTLPLTDPNNLNPNRPIKDIFNNKAPAKPYPVTEGMWIGDFTTTDTIGFEIELETELGLVSTLATYRTISIQVLTEGYTGLALKRRKELVTSYIDPAAFFGMHGDVGVNTTTYTGSSRNPSVPKRVSTGLYTDLISKFANKNRIYLDLKSEKGLSYNFYNNYKISTTDLRNIVLHEGVDQTTAAALDGVAQPYEVSGWPIIFFESIKNHNTTRNKLRFRLRIDGNTDPVLYIENKALSSINNTNQVYFYKNSAIKSDTQTVWTKPITLYFSHAGSTATSTTPANSNIANYIKAFYFIGSTIPQNNARLANEKYYDSAFCSIDLESLGDVAVRNGHVQNSSILYVKEKLQTDGTGNFSFAAQSGAYWDSQRVLFYSKAHVKSESSGKKYLNTYMRRLSFANAKFAADLRNDFYIVRKRYQTAGGNLDILGLNYYKKEDAPQEKEDLMLLGLSIAQLQALKSTPGLSSSHPRYIFLERDHANHLTDTSAQHHRYFRYSVKVQGVDNNGTPHIVTPNPVINLYSRDNIFFSSTTFAPAESLSIGANRIEFRIYRDGAIYINDNIDFSLVRKKVVDSLTSISNQPVYTLADDMAIAGDTSSVQNITYLFYDQDAVGAPTPPVNPPVFCTLGLVMADQRVYSTDFTPAESAAIETSDFEAINYNLIFDYTPFNVLGVWARRSYEHNTTHDIITRGKTKDNGTIGNKKYKKVNKKAFLVYVDRALVAASTMINNRFSYDKTVRQFARPDLLAVFLGALREIDDAIVCQGFAYPDASSFPSTFHVNGNAFDTNYLTGPLPNVAITDDLEFVRAIHKYGIGTFRIGPTRSPLRLAVNPVMNALTGIKWVEGGTLHNGHLHTEEIVIHK